MTPPATLTCRSSSRGQMKNPYDYYTIQTFKQDRYHDGICEVTRRTPRLVSIVATFDRYLQREMHYDFPMFDAEGDGYTAYLFSYGGVWVGACCFRDTKHAGIATPVPWLAEWVWIHPFCRRRGLLTKAWTQFEQQHGEFLILAPISPAMRRFLQKKGVSGDRLVTVRAAE